ncbi:MAG TPA: hypothetical protein VKE70_36730 [Candidatus Solibacter sp.]|nr:hypothetical protein [Candidatus Solibacter sp.]
MNGKLSGFRILKSPEVDILADGVDSRLRKNRGLTPISQRKPLIVREQSCEMGCLTPVFSAT